MSSRVAGRAAAVGCGAVALLPVIVLVVAGTLLAAGGRPVVTIPPARVVVMTTEEVEAFAGVRLPQSARQLQVHAEQNFDGRALKLRLEMDENDVPAFLVASGFGPVVTREEWLSRSREAGTGGRADPPPAIVGERPHFSGARFEVPVPWWDVDQPGRIAGAVHVRGRPRLARELLLRWARSDGVVAYLLVSNR